MSLASRVSDLATAIGNYLRDAVLPRLLPAGGTTGQALVKSSATNYHTSWQTLGSMASQNAIAVNIDGGSIDGTAIGTAAAASGKFTTVDFTGDYFSGRSAENNTSGHSRFSGVVMTTHPEDANNVIIPFLGNDLFNLLARGGSVIMTPLSAEATSVAAPKLFDCSSTFAVWYNPTGTIVVEVTLATPQGWNMGLGYSGVSNFRAKNVLVEVYDVALSAWVIAGNLNNYPSGTWSCRYNSYSTYGVSKLRFSFSNFASTSQFRLSQIFLYGYASTLTRQSHVMRDAASVDGQTNLCTISGDVIVGKTGASPSGRLSVDGSIAPYVSATYDCGTSIRKWKDVWIAGVAHFGNYTVSTVPSASTCGSGSTIYVTDASSGSNVYFSDGTNWRDAARNLLA